MPRTAPTQLEYAHSAILAQKESVRPVRLQLPKAHPKQYELISVLDKYKDIRFIVGACGTKFGKTYGSTIALVQQAWNNKDSLNWWVAPTFGQSKMAYSMVKRLLPVNTYDEYKADLKLVLKAPNGVEHSQIEFKSGDNPDSLRGYAVNFFIVDEAARVPYDSAISVLTTVTQTFGKGMFISTPKGRGYFYDFYQRGEKKFADGTPKYGPDEVDPWGEWYSIRMPTWGNPHVPRESIMQMKKNLPADVYEQEVAAKFLLDSAGVFKGISSCVKGSTIGPVPGRRYVIGVDLARLKDYSVIVVMDYQTRHLVHLERFNQIRWEVQYQKITAAAKKYPGVVLMDSTGLGDPVAEAVANANIPVVGYKISSNLKKQQLIDKLRVNIENANISFPNIPILLRELEAYEYTVANNGIVRFSAPSGKHDDTVIGLALANWGLDIEPFVYRSFSARGI